MPGRLAYLGPEGSYSHKAARILSEHLDQDIELEPYPNIRTAYQSELDFAVIPLENTIHGVVWETLQSLLDAYEMPRSKTQERSPITIRKRWTIVKDLDLKIDHCIAVKRGTKQEDVKWVMSHEQALGQCSGFLHRCFPTAGRISVSSTALAARLVALQHTSDAEGDAGSTAALNIPQGAGAAICSKEAVDSLGNLVIVQEAVQDVKDNYTRFLLFARNPTRVTSDETTGFRLGGVSGFAVLDNLYDLSMIPPHLQRIAIHSRPYSSPPQKYGKRYLVEIAMERKGEDDSSSDGEGGNRPETNGWRSRLCWLGKTG